MLKNFLHFHSESHNPYLNLAYEAYLLENLKETPLLFTYVNGPCVVFGNFQNPWMECNLNSMKKEAVLPVRRFSGGGAVFHDQGNLNISFLRPTRAHGKEINTKFMQNFLQGLGLPVFVNDRADLRIKAEKETIDRKISGSAFKQKKDRAYHHMSLLCATDLIKLNHYLASEIEKKIISKSIMSVRSQVANLNEYNPKIEPLWIAQKLAQLAHCSTNITEKQMQKIPWVHTTFLEMQSWDFIFGKTPKMELNFKSSEEEYRLIVTKGELVDFEVLRSNLHPSFMSELRQELLGKKFDTKLLVILEEKFRQVYQEEFVPFKNYLKDFL